MPTGKTITLDGVTASDTIDNVKAKIQDSMQGFQLVEKLEGGRMLSDGLMRGGKVTFQVVKKGFDIWVKIKRQRTWVSVEVEADDTIANLKAKIGLLLDSEHLPGGIPALLLRVGRRSGENFCSSVPISDYCIQKGDLLQASWCEKQLQEHCELIDGGN